MATTRVKVSSLFLLCAAPHLKSWLNQHVGMATDQCRLKITLDSGDTLVIRYQNCC